MNTKSSTPEQQVKERSKLDHAVQDNYAMAEAEELILHESFLEQ